MNTTRIPETQLRGRPLQNITCPYCGVELHTCSKTKEHVVGRRFVPVGTLNNNWNLIVWACQKCNRRKSDLEDDISAISMHLHTVGLPSMSDLGAQTEARRRSLKSVSRKTGKVIAASNVELHGSARLVGNAELTFRFNGPPQFDNERARELARLQMMAFFYFLTYDKTTRLGHFWKGGFYPVHSTIKSDWGNPLHRSFMSQCRHWDYRLILSTAGGYYRALIRRHPVEECWSWAIEWNHCYRMVGYFGDLEPAEKLAAELPPLRAQSILEAPNTWIRYRVDQPLAENDDILFIDSNSDEI
jgi:hypothetical protein